MMNKKKRESSEEIFLGGHRAGASIALPLKFKRYGEHSPGDSMRRNDLLEARQLMCSDFQEKRCDVRACEYANHEPTSAHQFWQRFSIQNKSLSNKLGTLMTQYEWMVQWRTENLRFHRTDEQEATRNQKKKRKKHKTPRQFQWSTILIKYESSSHKIHRVHRQIHKSKYINSI